MPAPEYLDWPWPMTAEDVAVRKFYLDTFGGKGHNRWLTDEEYAALCALGSQQETGGKP